MIEIGQFSLNTQL